MARGDPPASDADTLLRMKRQKQKDTAPEVLVRRLLYSLGHRFRIRNRDLPGSPDAANRSRRWAVFVHGCYWHQHPGCPRATVPKRNREFWVEKFRDNRDRDERVKAELQSIGYTVVTVWECEAEAAEPLKERLRSEIPSLR